MIDSRSRLGPVRDQGPRGTCVAFAGTAGHEALHPADGPLSEEFLNWGAKQRDGLPPAVEGTTLEAMAAALADLGQSTASHWRYDSYADHRAPAYGPTPEAIDDAAHRRLQNGVAIDPSNEDLIAALDDGALPVVGVVLFRTWHDALSDGRIAIPETDAVPLGRHAVLAVGYRSDPSGTEIIVRNSWGTDWGDAGYGYLPADYVSRYAKAAWRLDRGEPPNG